MLSCLVSSEVDQSAVSHLSGQSLHSPPPPRLPSLFYLQTLLQDSVAAEVIKTNRNVAQSDH